MRPQDHPTLRSPRRRRGEGRLWLGVVIAVLAVGAIGYWLYGQLQPPATSAVSSSAADIAPAVGRSESAQAGRGQNAGSPAGERSDENARGDAVESDLQSDRSDTILTCTAMDGEVFYTNATRCEDADLDNRLNVVASPSLPASRPDRCLGAQPGGAPVQGFLAVCQEPFNEALALEPFLLKLDDPAGSRAARRYCDYITAGVQAGCMATSDQFCFLHLCQALRESGGP